jgi:hypothetical protein
MAKAKKSKAKKPTSKKKAKKVKKGANRAAAKARRTPAKKSKKAAARKAAPRKAKKAAPKKKQKLVGEGDYAASRTFLKDQSDFVKKNKAKIPEMGRQAERALDGPEGDTLRAAEQEAMNRSVIE